MPVCPRSLRRSLGPRSRWADDSETAARAWRVFPWTPPVAARRALPTMSTADAMGRTLSSFMGSVSAGRPTNAIGRMVVRAVSAGRPANAISQIGSSGRRPGDDSQPVLQPIAVGGLSMPTSTRPQRPILLAVDQ
jgi:hypothetical protein